MSAPLVYIVLAEHWDVPGLICMAYATRAAAQAQAVAIVGSMVEDHNADLDVDGGEPLPAPTLDSWESLVAELQDFHGAEHLFVSVLAATVEGAP